MGYSSKEIRTLISAEGQLQLSLETVEIADPGPDEVVVQVQGAPVNPSDLGLLFGPADMTSAKAVGSAQAPRVVADVPPQLMKGVAGRVGQSMPVGNEGAGVVVATGDSEAARALMGKLVAAVGGGMYSQYRKLHAGACQVMPEGTTAADAASSFVNPMTTLGMLETMRAEGHKALVHTAAASNLGQMLVKLCQKDGVELVNIVRRPAQAELLRGLGAKHVVDSSAPTFFEDLVGAIKQTGATLAFDAVGGGTLASQILSAMEVAHSASMPYSRYGSNVSKQVYLYGTLDTSPTVLNRTFGMTWGVSGWLVTPALQKLGGDTIARLRARVADEIQTTFASRYSHTVSLAEALGLEAIAGYGKKATGDKYLIDPSKS